MSCISSRSINLSIANNEPTVTFTWFNHDAETGHKFEWKPIENLSNEDFEKVRRFLNDMGIHGWISEFKGGRFSIMFDVPITLHQLFDLAANSDDPVTVITSPYDVVIRAAIEVGVELQQ